MGVRGVVGVAVPGWLVGGDRDGADGQRLEVGLGPVQVVQHGPVRCLVQRGRHEQVRTLQDHVVPGIRCPPPRLEEPLRAVILLVPAGGELQGEAADPGLAAEGGEHVLPGTVEGVQHPGAGNRDVRGLQHVVPGAQRVRGDVDDPVAVRPDVPATVGVLETRLRAGSVVGEGPLHGVRVVEP